MPRQRDTINGIVRDINVQNYMPSNIVYSDSAIGQVRVIVRHITSNNPKAGFLATKAGSNQPAHFDTLGLALAHIGLPEA